MFLDDVANFSNMENNGIAEFKRRYETYLNNHLNDLSNNGMIRVNSSEYSPGYRITEPNTNIRDQVDKMRNRMKNPDARLYADQRYLRDELGGKSGQDSLLLKGHKSDRIQRVMRKRQKRRGEGMMTGDLDPSTYKTGSGKNFNVEQSRKAAEETAKATANKRRIDFEESLKDDSRNAAKRARESVDNMRSNIEPPKVDIKMPDFKFAKPKWYNSKGANIAKVVGGTVLGGYALKKAHDYQKEHKQKQIKLGF